MLSNSNDEKVITHFCQVANEGVDNRDTSDNDNDYACSSDDKEEEDKVGYAIPDEVYDFLNNYSKHKLIKVPFIILDVKKGTFLKFKDFKKTLLNCLKNIY